jgi:hypothetical protein
MRAPVAYLKSKRDKTLGGNSFHYYSLNTHTDTLLFTPQSAVETTYSELADARLDPPPWKWMMFWVALSCEFML